MLKGLVSTKWSINISILFLGKLNLPLDGGEWPMSKRPFVASQNSPWPSQNPVENLVQEEGGEWRVEFFFSLNFLSFRSGYCKYMLMYNYQFSLKVSISTQSVNSECLSQGVLTGTLILN